MGAVYKKTATQPLPRNRGISDCRSYEPDTLPGMTGIAAGPKVDAGRTLSAFSSTGKGPADILTRMRYSFARSDGTRHEYRQVKPQPYSKSPCWTILPFGSVMVKLGFGGRPLSTIRFVHTSPVEPTSDICSAATFSPFSFPIG
jgi:hypothetical protein